MSFAVDQKYLVLDFETASQADLRAVGAIEYARHPTTHTLCVAWRLGTRASLPQQKTYSWSSFNTNSNIIMMLNALADPSVVVVAHNFGFELAILRHTLSRELHTQARYLKDFPVTRGLCTAALASALALPRDLERAASVLGLNVQKDMDGRKLLLKMCKPRRASKKHPTGGWHRDPVDVERLTKYCETDVDVEVELFLRCPPLNDTERKVWELDQTINTRGVQIDIEMVRRVLAMVEVETANLDEETKSLSGIDSATKVAQMQAYLASKGCFLPDMTADTVREAITSGLAVGECRRLLEIRQTIGKTSTKKYVAFAACGSTGRVYDTLMYWAASTGRWGGKRFQLQNLPRSTIKNTNLACEIVRDGDLEMVRLLYGDPITAFSDCLRGVLVAAPDHVLYCSDFNAIETRVLFWMAGHEAGLQAYRDGKDQYKHMAMRVYSCRLDEVDSDQRQLGKKLVLGAGFGLGHKRFHDSCAEDGMGVSKDLAERAIKAYRAEHWPVPAMWRAIEKAAIAAVENPGKKYSTCKTSWWVGGKFLWCQLPSGRRLAYYGTFVRYEIPSWGGDEKRPVLYYWGVNAKTKQWAVEKNWGAGLVENVVQAVARDLMAEAMLRLEAAGYPIVLSVHDEIIAERPQGGGGSVDDFMRLMSVVPPWAAGLPVRVEGFRDVRYRK